MGSDKEDDRTVAPFAGAVHCQTRTSDIGPLWISPLQFLAVLRENQMNFLARFRVESAASCCK